MERRHHDIEGISGISTVTGRVGQWADDLIHLEERPGPPVRNEQWKRVHSFPPDMKKVEVNAIDLSGKLRESVEKAFLGSPIVALVPVVYQLPQIRKARSIVPIRLGKRIRPACPG